MSLLLTNYWIYLICDRGLVGNSDVTKFHKNITKV